MNGATKRILLFEADAPAKMLLEEILSSAGYSVISCTRGMEVLSAVRCQPPDLIVSELSTPGLDGHQVISILRRSGSFNGPIIVVSGRTREEDIQSALDAGAQVFLKKPVERGVLLEAVTRLLNPETGTVPPADADVRSIG